VEAGQLEGGARAVPCCLCPVKLGAFKRVVPSRGAQRGPWAHVVCGMWHTESAVMPGNVCDAIVGEWQCGRA
jgi:hypothetical protein